MSQAVQGHPKWMGHNEEFEKMWSAGEENDNPLQYSFLENPMGSMKRQKDRTLEDVPHLGQKMSNMLLGKSRGQLLRVHRVMTMLINLKL